MKRERDMKSIRKLLVLVLAVTLVLGMCPIDSQAAVKTKLNRTSASIYVGKTVSLKIKGTGKAVKWSSSNAKIAKVSANGKVIGLKAGKAVITAKVSGKKYRCRINVKNPYLNVTKKTITKGKSFNLKLTGGLAIKWSSSNDSVAVVSAKGKVTAKEKGTAIITCKCKNGNIYKCQVTVKISGNSSNDNGSNDNSGNDDSNISDNGHMHVYKLVRIIKEATDTEFGEAEYVCKVEDCGKTEIMQYGKEVQFAYQLPEEGSAQQTATRYGYWDTDSAKDILEGINEYRREKGFSDLQYLDKYEPYMREHVMSCYFNVCDFNIRPEGKSVRFICEGIGSYSHDKTYFKTKPGLLQPGNDGISNANLFEREDIEVGVGCFASIVYYSPSKNMSQQYYSEEYWQPAIIYDIVICIFEDMQDINFE